GRTFAGEKDAAGNLSGRIGGDIREGLFADAHQAFVGTNPEISQTVLDEIADIVARQPVGGRISGPASPLGQPGETVTGGAHPKRIVMTNEQAGNVLDRRSLGSKFAIAQQKQSRAFGAN